MALRYCLQHTGTGVFIASHPGMQDGYATTPHVGAAVSWSTRAEAELYRADFREFADTWAVMAVEKASIYDDPDELIAQRTDVAA